MKLPGLLLASFLFTGCVATQDFWDKEILAVYAPDSLREKDKQRLAQTLDYFLGKSKNERIRIIGAPDNCMALLGGEEACDWSSKGSAAQQRIAYTYNKDGIARAWSYRGVYGEFTDTNYRVAGSAPAAAGQPAMQQAKGWIHPTKAPDGFSSEYMLCQEELKQEPKANQKITMYEEHAIEDCMKQRGWVHR